MSNDNLTDKELAEKVLKPGCCLNADSDETEALRRLARAVLDKPAPTGELGESWTAVEKGLPKKPCYVNIVLKRLDGSESPFSLDYHFNGHSFIGRGTSYSKCNNFRSENYCLTHYMIIPEPPETDDEISVD